MESIRKKRLEIKDNKLRRKIELARFLRDIIAPKLVSSYGNESTLGCDWKSFNLINSYFLYVILEEKFKVKAMTEGEGFARRRQRRKAEEHISKYIKKCKQGKVIILPDQ